MTSAAAADEEEEEGEEPPTPTIQPKPTTLSRAERMGYRIGRGEQGVLTFEPYKSQLLPLWRFRTAAVARRSAADLRARFRASVAGADFVGADMARKFIQMGMTRAKRYANHAGGRKYEKKKKQQQQQQQEQRPPSPNSGRSSDRQPLPLSDSHAGRDEKLEASRVFREAWERCRADEEYQRLKRDFQAEQKAWDKEAASRGDK